MYRYKHCGQCNGSGKEIDHVRTGQNLREYRIKVGASLRKVAEICCWSASYLSDLEKGRRNWNEEKFTRFINAVDTFK